MKDISKLLAIVLMAAALFVVGSKLVVNEDVQASRRKPAPIIIATQPYNCGTDLCQGYRCVTGTNIDPACYNSTEILTAKCDGTFTYMPDFQNSCSVGGPYQYVWYSTVKKGHR